MCSRNEMVILGHGVNDMNSETFSKRTHRHDLYLLEIAWYENVSTIS